MAAEISNRKKLAALNVQLERIQMQIDDITPLAEAEPVEFDGRTVQIGALVVIVTKEGEVNAKVIAKKEAEKGVKGPGLMFKVETGTGFDTETRVVYPGQIARLQTAE